MAPTAGTIPPPISWAQNHELLYVIIDVECKDIEHNVTENSFTFKATNALDANKKYEVTLNFLKPVNTEKVTSKNIGRCIEYTIYKKVSGPYWKSLTNDTTKLHFLKANFIKFKPESDEEDELESSNFSFKNMVPPGSGMNTFDDFNFDEDYDSDDNIPSLSQNDEDEDDKKDEEKKDQEK